jgi:hypothetical protein
VLLEEYAIWRMEGYAEMEQEFGMQFMPNVRDGQGIHVPRSRHSGLAARLQAQERNVQESDDDAADGRATIALRSGVISRNMMHVAS